MRWPSESDGSQSAVSTSVTNGRGIGCDRHIWHVPLRGTPPLTAVLCVYFFFFFLTLATSGLV